MDFQLIKQRQEIAEKELRELVSLEQIAGEFYLNDIDDPMLYAMYKVVNKDKLTKDEILQIDNTIETLIKKQKRINNSLEEMAPCFPNSNDYSSNKIN